MAESQQNQKQKQDGRNSAKGHKVRVPRRVVTPNGVVLDEGTYTMSDAKIAENGLLDHQYEIVERQAS